MGMNGGLRSVYSDFTSDGAPVHFTLIVSNLLFLHRSDPSSSPLPFCPSPPLSSSFFLSSLCGGVGLVDQYRLAVSREMDKPVTAPLQPPREPPTHHPWHQDPPQWCPPGSTHTQRPDMW